MTLCRRPCCRGHVVKRITWTFKGGSDTPHGGPPQEEATGWDTLQLMRGGCCGAGSHSSSCAMGIDCDDHALVVRCTCCSIFHRELAVVACKTKRRCHQSPLGPCCCGLVCCHRGSISALSSPSTSSNPASSRTSSWTDSGTLYAALDDILCACIFLVGMVIILSSFTPAMNLTIVHLNSILEITLKGELFKIFADGSDREFWIRENKKYIRLCHLQKAFKASACFLLT